MKINIENSSEILEKYQYLILKTVNTFPIFEKDEALDEAREVLIDAIEDYDENKAGFGGYLKYRLYYHFLDKSKKLIPDSLNKIDSKGIEIEDSLKADIDIEKEVIQKEVYEKLYDAIKTLNQKDKVLIQMKYFENKSHKEIGKILGLTPKTVTNRNYKIIRCLRSKLLE